MCIIVDMPCVMFLHFYNFYTSLDTNAMIIKVFIILCLLYNIRILLISTFVLFSASKIVIAVTDVNLDVCPIHIAIFRKHLY